MKKIYAGLAIATALSASAANFDAPKAGLQTMGDIAVEELGIAPIEYNSKGVQRAAATAAEAAPMMMWQYYSLSSSDGRGEITKSMQITLNGTEATLWGFFDYSELKGEYDAANGTIRLAEQQLRYTYRGEHITFYPQKIVQTATGEEHVDVPFVEFQYAPAGVELKNKDGETWTKAVGGWYATDLMYLMTLTIPSMHGTNSGFQWTYQNFFVNIEDVYPNLSWFKFNDADWTKVSNATLDDGWMRALTSDGSGFAPYSVECYVQAGNSDVYLLKNPYGVASPYANVVNATPTMEGFIILDVANKDCVLVRPFVNSGLTSPDFFLYNQFIMASSSEGWSFYADEYSTEEIIEEAEAFGDAVSNMVGQVVTIPNCRVQEAIYAYELEQWEAEGGIPIPMESVITLPSLDSVSTIGDEVGATKRFFNLQGVEISNPEAGQVVIVKEGSKTSKVIR